MSSQMIPDSNVTSGISLEPKIRREMNKTSKITFTNFTPSKLELLLASKQFKCITSFFYSCVYLGHQTLRQGSCHRFYPKNQPSDSFYHLLNFGISQLV